MILKRSKTLFSLFFVFAKQKRGFTMAELIVSVSIIAMISAIFIGGYNYYSRSGNLKMTANKLVSDIRMAQNYSLGSKDFEGITPEGGWGIYLDEDEPSYYIIYANVSTTDNLKFSSSEEYRRIDLPSGVLLEDILVDSSSSGHSRINLIFEPPDPTIYICKTTGASPCDGAHPGDGEIVEIVLGDNSGETITIEANIFGLVDVKR